MHHSTTAASGNLRVQPSPSKVFVGSARSAGPHCAHREHDPHRHDIGIDPQSTSGSAFVLSASAIGLSPILPNVPSRRGAEASRVANAACTARRTPTCVKNRRDVLGRGSSGIFEPRFVRGFLGQRELRVFKEQREASLRCRGGDEQPLLDGTMPAKSLPGWPPHATSSSNISSLALAARA